MIIYRGWVKEGDIDSENNDNFKGVFKKILMEFSIYFFLAEHENTKEIFFHPTASAIDGKFP